MKKIPTVFVRDPDDPKHVTDEITPGCEWVLNGEGRATRKYDGTCVMLDGEGRWWARREVKPGKEPPPGWIEADHDPVTGKRPGWEPIEQSPFYREFLEAEATPMAPTRPGEGWLPGTFELIGPRINGNPEGWHEHVLMRHGCEVIEVRPFDIRELVRVTGRVGGWEGIVWHHPDGRLAKLKARDLA
jgi:hypothetical protein